MLAESARQIENLKVKNNLLLQTLKTVAARPNLDPDEYAKLSAIITNYELETQDTSSIASSTPIASSERTYNGSHLAPSSEKTPSASTCPAVGELSDLLGKYLKFPGLPERIPIFLCPLVKTLAYKRSVSDRTPATQFNYFMDDEDLLSLDEDYVNELHWPGDITTTILCEAFFHSLHGVFYCFNGEKVLTKVQEFPRDRISLSWDQRRWLAVTNLVWAIGSRWLRQAMLHDEPGMEHHLVYYARARALGLDHRVMLDHPGLQGINALGLLSLYLFTNGSVHRAWAIGGLAIRNATCLGLHLKAADSTLSSAELKERARLWYSLYSLEVAMSEVLGKPPLTSLEYTTVPVDILNGLSIDETLGDLETHGSRRVWLDFLRRRRGVNQTMRGGSIPWQTFQFIGYGPPRQHLSFRARLSRISNHVMTKLYMPNLSDSWATTQKKIAGLNIDLLEWEKSLPEELRLESTMAMATDPRAKIDLALYHQSIRMILYRPCLCHIRIPNESIFSKEFNLSGARSCVCAGIALIDILPDDPTAHEAYQLLPWNLLHYLGQALAVFVLELCLNMEHFDGSAVQLKPYVRKAMSYLWCLTAGSLSAYQAWRIFRQMLSILSLRVDRFDIVDIPVEALIPTGWTAADEALLMDILRPIGESGMPSV